MVFVQKLALHTQFFPSKKRPPCSYFTAHLLTSLIQTLLLYTMIAYKNPAK